MFSLKSHARKNFRIIALGAAASAACITSAASADYSFDDVYFDPALSAAGTGSGGTGSFDNTTVNFFNPRLNADKAIFYPSGVSTDPDHLTNSGYWQGDVVHFATTGGAVTVNNPTNITQMAIDVDGYTIGGAAITLGGGYGNHFHNPFVILNQATGNSTINANVFIGGYGSANVSNAINVTAGTLTMTGTLYNGTSGNYSFANLIKTGAGTLNISGKLTLSTQAFSGLVIQGGAVMFSGPAATGGGYEATGNGNDVNQDITVMSGATIGGGGGVRINGAQPNFQNGSQPHFTVQSGGHLAPGNNPSGSNFGTVGTFNLNGGYSNGQTHLDVNLNAGSNLDLDIASASSYDSFSLTGGNYSGQHTLNIASGAVVNVNALNPLTPGTYHIITETPGSFGQTYTITDGGFVIGTAPAGFTYSFVDLAADAGIDLVIAPAAGGVPAGSGTWKNGTGDGKWTTNTATNSNWATGIPNGSDQVATFDDTVINGPGTVDLDGNKTVGGIVLNTASVGYTLGLPATANILTLQETASNATITVTGGATHTINAAVSLASNTDVSLASGTVLKMVGAVSGAGNMNVSGAGTLLMNSSGNSYGSTTLNGATLGGSGTITGSVLAGSGAHTIYPSATLASGSATTLTVGGLTTNGNTTLKFNLNTPNSPGGSDLLHVTGGLDVSGGGALSFVDNFAGEGYYKIMQVGGTTTGNPTSLTVPSVVTNTGPAGKEAYIVDTHHDAGFVDVHKALVGDANGDGSVDGADFDIWFTHLLANTFDYGSGDFNGDGHVDGGDFDIWFTHLLNTFGGTDTTFGGFSSTELSEMSLFLSPDQMASLPTGVPEPASLALLGLGAVGLLGRRRNRR